MSDAIQFPANGKGYSIRAQKGSRAELYLYDTIDRYFGIGADQVRKDLQALGTIQELSVRINSEGGQIFEGLAIHTLLKAHAAEVTVYVDGMALSIASLIAMGGDKIVVAESAMMMIHDPMGFAAGDADELRSYAEVLDNLHDNLVKIYAARTGQPYERVVDLMAAETWMDAAEAVKLGFADRIDPQLAMAACAVPKTLDIPERFQARFHDLNPEETPIMADSQNTPDPKPAQTASYQDLKAAFPKADAEFLTGQLDAQATLDQARAAYQTQLETRADEATKKAEEAEAKAAATEETLRLAAVKEGVPPVGSGKPGDTAAGGDAVDQFSQRVLEVMNSRKLTRRAAVLAVAKQDPELHQAYLAQSNPQRRKVQELIAERFEM